MTTKLQELDFIGHGTKWNFSIEFTDIALGETLLLHTPKFKHFILEFKVVCFGDCGCDYPEEEYYDNERKVNLYCKFTDKKTEFDNDVWIYITGQKGILVSSSHVWTEIYNHEYKYPDSSFDVKLNVQIIEKEKDTTIIYDNPAKCIYNDEDLVDFYIVVGEPNTENKQRVGFHRAILSSWSPVFKNMFTGPWKEKEEGEVKLPLTIEVVEALKKFVYLQELPSERETLLRLVELGYYHMIPKLETDGIQAVVNMTNTDNINDTLEFSYIHRLEHLTAAMLLKIKTPEIDVKPIVNKLISVKVEDTSIDNLTANANSLSLTT